MHRKQERALANVTLVALGFIFRNSDADERANHTADSAANTRACERSHDWSSCDEGTKPRDRESANTSEKPYAAADYAA